MLVRYVLSSCIRLSAVTNRCSVKMAKCRIIETTPCDSPETLVICCQRSLHNSDVSAFNWGTKGRLGRLKSAIFDQYLTIISKMVQDRDIVTMDG